MALPPFPNNIFGLLVLVAMLAAGITGLTLVLLDREVAFAAVLLGQPFPFWFFARPGRILLILQATSVIMGVVSGKLFQSCSLLVIGIIAGLVFVTPVGLLTVIPAVLLIPPALLQLGSFVEFRPKWRGPGPPPPGPWR